MDTHSSMAAAAAAAALYKQLSTLAGFVSQSSVTRTGHAARCTVGREGGRDGERDMDRPGAIDRRELIGMAIPWSPRSGRARARGEGVRASQYRDY